jgi:hypothetical protein
MALREKEDENRPAARICRAMNGKDPRKKKTLQPKGREN